MGGSSARLAVLIDAENVPMKAIEALVGKFPAYGTVQVLRAYGDWSGALLGWKKTLLEHAIRPVQVFAAVKGKNAADLALTIDAVDLLHAGAVDGICLVSSDSDFTRLAERIREAGLAVHGFGEAHANPALIAACDTFDFIESVTSPASATPARVAAVPMKKARMPATSAAAVPAVRVMPTELRGNAALVRRLTDAVATHAGPDGWAPLTAIGQEIRTRPALVLKTYGYARLKDLMAATELFEFHQHGPGRSGAVSARVKATTARVIGQAPRKIPGGLARPELHVLGGPPLPRHARGEPPAPSTIQGTVGTG
jgi:hypothetical protein